jgi:hypothetical protein
MLQEWDMGDFEQEMLKRVYQTNEFSIKLKRLWKFYGKVVHRPKVVIKEYDTLLRRYFRYQAKRRLQVSYLFGKEDPVEQFNSSDQSSSHSSEKEAKEMVPTFNVLEELRKVIKEEQFTAKPHGFHFQNTHFNPNISQILRGAKKKPEVERSIMALDTILKQAGLDVSVEKPSFLNENSSDISIVINGTEKLFKKGSPYLDKPTSKVQGQVLFFGSANFKKKQEPRLVAKTIGKSKGDENTNWSKDISKQGLEGDLKKVYKISSRQQNGQNGEPTLLQKLISQSKSSDRDSTHLMKKSIEGKLTDREEKKSTTTKPTQSSSGQTLIIKGKGKDSKAMTSANLLTLMKKSTEGNIRISTVGLGSTVSSVNLKPQLLTKLIKKPSDTNMNRNFIRQAQGEQSTHKRNSSAGPKGSKGGSRKHSKQNSPEKSPIALIAQPLSSIRTKKPENSSQEHFRSASKNYQKGRSARVRGTDSDSGYHIEVSGGSKINSKLATKVYHSKNLSDFNITRGNLSKLQESARQKARTKTTKLLSAVGKSN